MQRVHGRTAAGVLATAFAAALMLAAIAGACPKNNNGHASNGKTTICHHTSSETNPWVRIRVSNSSLKAHAKHGDLIPAPAEGCPSGGDDDGGGDDGGGGLPT
jgi:ABC-type sugar transport system substrate-binding protein